ncbi:NUDIX domain-containing protein [Brevibacillus sp. SYSU BS000544]|uniref:NUDIX domain-containing protein n=1 Tax=Brevibacillus sp. SYSU BS000544 TaxID=3416443 RepID=UPI003CE48956
MYHFTDYSGLPVTLTFDPKIYIERLARHVLVFAFWNDKLLFTLHTKRGIELPGGKVEAGESSIVAAIRETYEETGCILSAIEKVGQYTVNHTIVKDIFIAKVERQTNYSLEGTVGGLVLFDELPLDIKADERFSPFLKDDVYPLTLQHLRSHPFCPIPHSQQL